jgi:hypothetical protein
MREAYWYINYNKDGSKHIRCDCKQCGKFIKWVSQDNETMKDVKITKTKELF